MLVYNALGFYRDRSAASPPVDRIYRLDLGSLYIGIVRSVD
jgi:hypothetical protein